MADSSELAARVMHTGRAFGRILAVPAVPARRLTIVIALCAGYGVLTQALFFGVDTGLSWLLFIAGSGLLVLRAFGGRTWLGIFWFIAALWAATAYVVYASDWSAYTAAPLSVGLILSLPLVVGRRLKVQELATLPASATRVVREFPRAVRQACDLPTLLARGEARQELRRAFVGVLLGLPLSGAFIAGSHVSARLRGPSSSHSS